MSDLAPSATTCNAQIKIGAKLRICDLPLGHGPDVDHADGEFHWKEPVW